MERATQETYYFDYSHPRLHELVEPFRAGVSERERIQGLYLRVRDGWRYSPFDIGLRREHFRASEIAAREQGHCVDKSILFISGLRALGIPARLRLAKVTNHLATERIEAILGTHVLTPHGMAEVYTQGRWVKAAPIFNRELCERYGVEALPFDGTADSVLQQYNRKQEKFMEYLEDYGGFDDFPLDFVLQNFRQHYPTVYRRFRDQGMVDFDSLKG